MVPKIIDLLLFKKKQHDLLPAEQIRSWQFQRVTKRPKPKQLAIDADAEPAVTAANDADAGRVPTAADGI